MPGDYNLNHLRRFHRDILSLESSVLLSASLPAAEPGASALSWLSSLPDRLHGVRAHLSIALSSDSVPALLACLSEHGVPAKNEPLLPQTCILPNLSKAGREVFSCLCPYDPHDALVSCMQVCLNPRAETNVWVDHVDAFQTWLRPRAGRRHLEPFLDVWRARGWQERVGCVYRREAAVEAGARLLPFCRLGRRPD